MIVFVILCSLPFIGWYVFTSLFDILFKSKEQSDTYIIHNHYHYDNRQVHFYNTNHLEEYHHQIED